MRRLRTSDLPDNSCRNRHCPRGQAQARDRWLAARESDVTVSENDLIEGEIKELERIVPMYLDYAENQAARQIPIKMADWVQKLDAFLKFNEYEVLTNASKVSKEVGDRLAEERYAEFRLKQNCEFESDFEPEVKRIERRPS